MMQVRLYTETNEPVARQLQKALEAAFEDNGHAIAAFEDIDEPGAWTVSIYVDEDDTDTVLETIKNIIKQIGTDAIFNREDLEDTDWVAKTLSDLHPVRAGQFVIHGSHDRDAPREHEIGVEIDAGLAFGTGHHGTTAGCLDMLSGALKREEFRNVLDLGTGSGVLAIALAKLHKAQVLASDIDPVSTKTARDNTRINGVQNAVECITANGLNDRRFAEQGPFDLVIANILAKPLMSMARDISRSTLPGGLIILSGLLPHQKRMILATFRQHGFFLRRTHIRDGWLSMVFRKP